MSLAGDRVVEDVAGGTIRKGCGWERWLIRCIFQEPDGDAAGLPFLTRVCTANPRSI